jgi:hypothetical protein
MHDPPGLSVIAWPELRNRFKLMLKRWWVNPMISKVELIYGSGTVVCPA